ncbi:MAG: DUF2066 domain-containing protein [Alphaproteobacteria bacterium]
MKIFATTFLCLLLSFNAFAVEYSSIISINVTDKDATSAKKKAWAHANRVALNNVMKKISNNVSLDYLTDDQILNLVKQTEVLSEKNSSTTYIGKLKVVFNQETLDEFLEEKNIQKLNLPSSKALIIPFYKEGLQKPMLLWEEENLLKKAFEKNTHSSIIDIETIKNNANNYSLVNTSQVINLNTELLEQIAYTNIAQNIFIVDAQNQENIGLVVKITHYSNGKTSTDTFNIENSKNMFSKAVDQTLEYINNKIKENSLKSNVKENKINAIFNFTNLHQWLWVKNDLSKATYIKNINPIAMQNGKIEMEIDFSGDFNQLLYSIKNKGLTLKENSGYYILERI